MDNTIGKAYLGNHYFIDFCCLHNRIKNAEGRNNYIRSVGIQFEIANSLIVSKTIDIFKTLFHFSEREILIFLTVSKFEYLIDISSRTNSHNWFVSKCKSSNLVFKVTPLLF